MKEKGKTGRETLLMLGLRMLIKVTNILGRGKFYADEKRGEFVINKCKLSPDEIKKYKRQVLISKNLRETSTEFRLKF